MNKDIFSRIENASKPDFGNVLSKSFDFVPKIWQEALKHSLIVVLVMLPLILMVYIPFFPVYMELLQNAGDPYYQPEIMNLSVAGWIIYGTIIFVGSFLGQMVSISVTAHFYKVCKNIDLGVTEDLGGYFDLLKDNFVKLLVLSLATTGIAIAAALLCYLPIFYVMVPLQLFVPILAFNSELSVSEIIKASFKLGNKFWLILFGLIWLSSLIAQVGIIFCGIGIIVTAYFVHLTIYYFYKDAIGFEASLPEA